MLFRIYPNLVDGSISRIHTADEYCSITLSMLCDTETSLIHDCTVNYKTNERVAFEQQLQYVNNNDICVMDC